MSKKIELVCPVCGSVFARYPSQLNTIGKIRVCSRKCRNVLGREARRESYARSFEDRFWKRVKKSSGCWEWQGSTTSAGYGSVAHGGRDYQTHRVAYELHFNTKIPDNLYVLHECDNRRCVRPDHLRVGTHIDNMADMRSKGRSSKNRGERNANARLSDIEVEQIRDLYESGDYTQTELAEKFGVGQTHISRLVNRRMRCEP